MSSRKSKRPYSKNGYFELHNQDENEPRTSIDSLSPILPKEFEELERRIPGENATFSGEGLEEYYEPIKGYEGAHRYDQSYSWSSADEAKVVWKIDKWICSWVCLMFFALQLDRGNIVQALSDGLLDDLGLNTNDYNYGQAIFYFAFLSAELPSQLISKWIGPDRWIPIQMVSWSLIASCQSLITGRKSYFLCRALIGMVEGGFIPDNVLYLSYFYTSKELPKRLSWFWVSSQLTNIVSAFLAYGLLHLRGFAGFEGWRWLFALEGILTGLIGVFSWFYLPPSPTQTPGWFSVHEETIMVNRILRDDPGKGDMHNRQALSFEMIKECLLDYHMFPIYLIGISFGMVTTPMTAYLTLQLREIGFDTFQTNLLTIPAYTLFIFQLLSWTWLSEKINQRFLVGLSSQVWAFPLLVFLEFMSPETGPWTRYAVTALLVGHPYVHAINVAITSRNAGTVRTRTVASALYNMTVQASAIISQNFYRDDDKPLYRRGNKILIGLCIYNFFLFIGAKLFYVYVNDYRAKIWDKMTLEEKQDYVSTTTNKGNKRLDFRFAH